MTLCAERKPLSYMTAEFNFLEHSLYREIVLFSYITPFCMLKIWMCLVSCKRHKRCDNFVCMPFANDFKCKDTFTLVKNFLLLYLCFFQ